MTLFAALDRLKADLDALRPLAPEQEQRVMQKFRLDWNYHSNAIEGNSLTLGETRSLLLHGLTAEGKPLRDHLDIKGHNEAILGLEEVVHDERPLTEQFIREMHQVLLGDEHYKPAHTASGQPTRQRIVPCQYKSTTNNVVTATGETFFFATPEETPAKMHDLLTWYRQEVEMPTLHPVALAAEFHHRFVSIHPFDDGNGRMSRLLMNLILMRHGYPIAVIKADETTRNRYLAALSAADAGAPEPFLRFIIENVEASLQLMIRAAKGESIEEPSDLDKKLALLKKQVLSREDAIEMAWNLKSQTFLKETLLDFWFDDLARQVARFDDLFLQAGKFWVLPSGSGLGFEDNEIPTVEAAKQLAEMAFGLTQSVFEKIYFRFEWSVFKSLKNAFDLFLMVDFVFKDYELQVTYRLIDSKSSNDIMGFLFASHYRKSYEHAHIHEINYQLANKVYNFIEAKVAEADPFPS